MKSINVYVVTYKNKERINQNVERFLDTTKHLDTTEYKFFINDKLEFLAINHNQVTIYPEDIPYSLQKLEVAKTNMNNKLKIGHIATELENGKLKHVDIPLNMYKTIEELREFAKSEIDKLFDYVIEKSVGHDITHAVYVHPLIHLVFNDLNKDNETWQNVIKAEKN